MWKIERLPDHGDCGFGNSIGRELVEGCPYGLLGIGGAGESPTDRPAQIIDEDVVIARPAVGIETDAIQYFDHRADIDVEPGFFKHLANDGRTQRFSDFNGPAGQAPLAFKRFVSTPDQEDAVILDDDGPDPNDRPLRICPRIQCA